jgi:predicted membrane-bound spermidine synthase
MHSTSAKASWQVLTGVALVGAAGLTLELVLTRLMSLTLYHHFAVLAVSLAMLGLGAGGVAVYVYPRLARPDGIARRMAWTALGFSASAVLCFLAQLRLPLSTATSLAALTATAGKLLTLATPFFFASLCMAMALRRYTADAGRVYGFDLLGAGIGCVLSVAALAWLGGRGALVSVSVLGGMGAWFLFASEASANAGRRYWIPLALATTVVAVSWAAGSRIDLRPPNRKADSNPIVERWNAFSRVAVYPIADSRKTLRATVSTRYAGDYPQAKFIQIDSSAGSDILDFSHGDLSRLEYLLHDIAYVGFHLHDRPGKVLVIGPGGGRDVLAALLTGRREITGVEVNPLIADLVQDQFGAFSGQLWRRPGLHLVVDEARSFLARDTERYAFIHASLACTWAATAGGAFVLTENSLYTRESFRSYLKHLDNSGILSMTMWYRGRPGELLRLAALGQQALRERGVTEPGRHIAVVRNSIGQIANSGLPTGFGTFLLKRSPFTPAEIARLRDLVNLLGLDLLYAPGLAGDRLFQSLLEDDPQRVIDDYPLDITPPTDDRPFFFYQLRPGDYLRMLLGNKPSVAGSDPLHRSVAAMLIGLLAASAFWVLILLIAPVLWTGRGGGAYGLRNVSTLAYFGLIGLAFILVEIALLQQLALFLGKPLYAFSVVLFTLLVCAGIGSLLAQRTAQRSGRTVQVIFALLTLWLSAIAFGLPEALAHAMPWPESLRILLALLSLAPLGLLLGFPLPLAMLRLGSHRAALIPLAWAINGASSVLASVLAMAIAINWGLRTTLVAGLACYLAAWLLWPMLGRFADSGEKTSNTQASRIARTVN